MAVKDKAEAQPVRQYARLDSIAVAKRGSDVQVRRAEITAMEASMNASPINPGGYASAGFMRSQIAQQIAEKREALKAVEALTGDDVVYRYCGDILNVQPPVELRQQDGSPLARGAVMQGIAPGMM
jgi:hypothetical protein